MKRLNCKKRENGGGLFVGLCAVVCLISAVISVFMSGSASAAANRAEAVIALSAREEPDVGAGWITPALAIIIFIVGMGIAAPRFLAKPGKKNGEKTKKRHIESEKAPCSQKEALEILDMAIALDDIFKDRK